MNTQSTAHFNGQVAFIDAGVFDPASISSHFQCGTEIHLLNSSQDGIDQITQFLAGRSDIKAVQIVSHGHDGELQLGNTDVTDLSAYDHDLQLWSKALSTDADILLYGCDLAQSNTGKAWVNELAQRTGADVAASTNLTGNAALAGDWNLEYSTGKIDVGSLTDPEYQWTLANFAVTNLGDSAAPGSGTLRAAINAANALGGSNDIFFPQLQGTITLSQGELYITDNGLRIHGPGEKSLTVSGNNASRVFEIASGGNVEMTGLTIANGHNNDIGGGGIYNSGTLAIYSSTVFGNYTYGGGGGILNNGTMLIDGDTFSENRAFAGTVGLSYNGGGGILNNGTVSVNNSTFSHNYTAGVGGGIDNRQGYLSVNSSNFSSNGAFAGGGIFNNSNLSLNQSTFSGNSAPFGGGIANLGTVKDTISTFYGNQSYGSGSGVIDSRGGSILLQGTKITDNSGGGIHNASSTVQLKNVGVYRNSSYDLAGNFVSLGTNTIGKGEGFTGIVDGVNSDRILVA